MATSFVLVHEPSQVLDVVTTNDPDHEVQVVVVEAQVNHEASQAKQFDPLSIVLSVSQLETQVLSLRSSFLLDTHAVQVVVVPEQVWQLEFHGRHLSVAESYIDSSAGQVLTHDDPYKKYFIGLVRQEVHVVLVPLHVNHFAFVESHASQVFVTIFPKVPSGHVSTQVVPDKNSNPVFPHLVQIFSPDVEHATHIEFQSSHTLETGSFPSSHSVTHAFS